MNLIKKQTFKSTFYSYISAALGLITQGYIVPNFFSTEQNGLINIFLSSMMLFPLFANLGFNGAGTRYFPYFRNSSSGNHGYLFLAFLFSFIGYILTVLFLIIYKEFLVEEYESKSYLIVKYYNYLIPITGFMLLFNIFDIYNRLHYDSVTGTFLSQFVLRLNNLVCATLYALNWIDFNFFMVIWSIGISIPMISIIISTIHKNIFSIKPDFSFLKSSKLFWPIIRFCCFSLVASISSQIVLYIDKFMLSSMLGLDKVGVYSTAAFFGTVIAMPMIAMQQISATVIAEAWKNDDRESIHNIYKKSCVVQIFIGLFTFGCMYINLDNIFTFIPKHYETGKMVVIWIGLSKVIDMATGINGVILNTSKYYYFDTLCFLFLGICTVFLNFYLIPIFGIEGAAVGTTISVFIYNSIRSFLLWYLFKFQPFNLSTLYLLLINIFCLLITDNLPTINGSYFFTFLDLSYRTIIFASLWGGLFIWGKFSPEFNLFIFSFLNSNKKQS